MGMNETQLNNLLHNQDECPLCGSEISILDKDNYGDRIIVYKFCYDCRYEFDEVYTLSAIRDRNGTYPINGSSLDPVRV